VSVPRSLLAGFTTFSGNLEMSGNSAKVSEKSGNRPKVGERSGICVGSKSWLWPLDKMLLNKFVVS